ncbi:hypothetical protein [Cellulomonas endometrii]|uniref:hypothetical protein n=1 Tax=Cellulomonas endometrii TaxID=3036301 RepID=UPI0024ACDEDC|nr:hypothetical protein [Cellulomonas endometrii]
MTATLAGRVPLAGRAPRTGRAAGRSRPAGEPGAGAAATAEGALEQTARLWAGLGALGLGLVTEGVAAGHLARHPGAGVALAAVGLAVLGWAVAALRGPVRGPAAAVGALLLVGPAVLLAAPLTQTRPTAAEAAALALGLGTAIALALGRRAATAPGPRRALGPRGQAGVLAAGALLVALVTVPGLAATEAGAHAVPHGSHGLPAEQGHAGH